MIRVLINTQHFLTFHTSHSLSHLQSSSFVLPHTHQIYKNYQTPHHQTLFSLSLLHSSSKFKLIDHHQQQQQQATMSGVWVFNKKGVARLFPNPTRESFEHKEPTRSGSATAPGARRRVLVYLPANQVITSYSELEQRLNEVGWVRYENIHKPDLIQYHRSPTSVHLISLPKNFTNFKTTHMYDIVVKNRSYFEVRDN